MTEFHCCQQLDDYFDGDLSPEELAKFQLAIRNCDSCRLAVEQQNQIDQSLSEAWNGVSAPASLEPTPQVSLAADANAQSASQPWPIVVTSLLIAAAILLAIFSGVKPQVDRRSDEVVRLPGDGDSNEATPPPAVVEFDGESIGVVDEISNDEFTLVRVYETIHVTQED